MNKARGMRITGIGIVVAIMLIAIIAIVGMGNVNEPNGAGVAMVNDALAEGYQTFEGGYFTGGTGDGAGIRVYGTFNLYGGRVRR